MSTGLVLARVCAQRGIPTVRQQGTIASRTPLYARRMLDTTHAQVGYNSNSTATSVWSPQCCQLLGRCKNPDNTIRQPPQPSHYAGSRVFQWTRAPIDGGGGRRADSGGGEVSKFTMKSLVVTRRGHGVSMVAGMANFSYGRNDSGACA